ncbi:sulfate adenylyltransferase subunit 1 [Yinghuangia soli]|uniref:sulfate adenylyltransferase n=1 Tax=Yinghuangia soli TaxID=2908204 RepID=A0AA41U554_9ACTN|nr:GTP-binding protein [Yinghuangia soli]MCF2529649.1 GTP-binding protein [Yinghuangia soli]
MLVESPEHGAESADPTESAGSTGLLRIATAGSVDDGKSTLIGRLLHDAKAVFEDQLAAVAATSERRGASSTDLSLLTDGLRAEREQGITIDVAYRYFATPARTFIIADTPGHVQYTRNMVTGASTADVAMVLVDARKGLVEQSRRHALLASLLRVPHVVLCVNKMDLVGHSQAAFNEIREDFAEFAGLAGIGSVTAVPMSALHGDNVVEPGTAMPWYGGPPLLRHLETLRVPPPGGPGSAARLPVQYVLRPAGSGHRRYAGSIAAGSLQPGDAVIVLPSGRTGRIAEVHGPDGPVGRARAPFAVAVTLDDQLDVSRGDMICSAAHPPHLGQDIDATVCWMTARHPLRPGATYLLKHTTRTVRARVAEVVHRLDVGTGRPEPDAGELALNEIGRVRLRTSAPLMYDAYRDSRATGSFILIDEATGDTAGAAIIGVDGSVEAGPGESAEDSTREHT